MAWPSAGHGEHPAGLRAELGRRPRSKASPTSSWGRGAGSALQLPQLLQDGATASHLPRLLADTLRE